MELEKARTVIAEITQTLRSRVVQIVEDNQHNEGRIRANFKGSRAHLTFHARKDKAPDTAFTIKRDGTVEGICIKEVIHLKEHYLNIPPWYWQRNLGEGDTISFSTGVSLLLDPATLATKEGKEEVRRFLEAGMQVPGSGYLVILI